MEKVTFGEKFRALLATGRVANLPTVWSNVLVAFYLALSLDFSPLDFFPEYAQNFNYWLLFFGCLAGSCLYVGGCMLGDYRDIQFDRENRPSRPLVTGVLSPGVIAITAASLLFLGLLFGGLGSAAALTIAFELTFSAIKKAGKDDMMTLLQVTQLSLLGLLLIFIVIYALFHKKSRPFALLNMALCRTQLIIFAAAMAMPLFYSSHLHGYAKAIDHFHFNWLYSPVLIPALAVGAYTLLLASVAATESNKDKIKFSRALKTSMFLLPLVAILAILVTDSTALPLYGQTADSSLPKALPTPPLATLRWYFIGTVIIYCSWMIYSFSSLPADKPAFVSRALAGFCLLDACFAATYSVILPLVCFILFGLALLLQKLAPAT